MDYNTLKELAETKNILLKTLCEEIGYTRAGLKKAVDNETIELRKLKLLCDILKITPLQFFETANTIMTGHGHVQLGNGNKIIIENKDREIEYLKQQVEDKNEIIRMLREKLDMGLAANPKPKYGKKS